MATRIVTVRRPHCGSENVAPNGHNAQGKRVYRCKNAECSHYSFVEEYTYNGCKPEVRREVLKMAARGSGTRDIAAVKHISKDTVTAILRKIDGYNWHVNYDYIDKHKDIQADIISAEDADIDVDAVEMDEMWSYVHDKKQQYWLWWAIDHNTGEPLAFCFGTREYKYLDELRKLLAPFHIEVVYADNNFAYESRITESQLITGKKTPKK